MSEQVLETGAWFDASQIQRMCVRAANVFVKEIRDLEVKQAETRVERAKLAIEWDKEHADEAGKVWSLSNPYRGGYSLGIEILSVEDELEFARRLKHMCGQVEDDRVFLKMSDFYRLRPEVPEILEAV